jgi:hypothetical protein
MEHHDCVDDDMFMRGKGPSRRGRETLVTRPALAPQELSRNSGLADMAHKAKNREANRRPKPDQELPPPGPHSKPELTDKEKTGGTGMLAEQDEDDVEGPLRLTIHTRSRKPAKFGP